MEDLNNNEDYGFVPDFLMPDQFTSKQASSDEQSVPIFNPGGDQFTAADLWHGGQMNFSHPRSQGDHFDTGYGNYDGALSLPLQRISGGVRPSTDDGAANISSPPPVPSTSFAPTLHCPVCCRTFQHKLSLTNHQRSHTTKQPHLCTICGETFKYKTNFKRHRRVHAKEMKICRYCGANMESDYDLVQHEKEHRRQQKQL